MDSESEQDHRTSSEQATPQPAVPESDGPAVTPSPWTVANLLPVALIVAVTIVAFAPTLGNDFVNWDDDVNLLNNEQYRGLWPKNIQWMFSTTHQGPYQPLAWLTFAVDYLIWGMKPVGYHLTSLLLHVAGAVVFYLIAARLLRLAFGQRGSEGAMALSVSACLAALIFAVHPLRVESVAWATERRDVLSGLFFLLSIWAYLRARTPRTEGPDAAGGSLVLPLLFFMAALLSKGTTLVLPIILLLLDVYPLRRLSGSVRNWFAGPAREVWFEKLLFVIPAVLAGWVAVKGQMQAGALLDLSERGIADRIAAAVYGPAFYLYKTLVPLGLSPLYEWPVDFSPLGLPILLGGVALIALTVLFVRFREHWPAGLVLWVAYLVFLAPVLVPFQAGQHLAADRYSYLACTGWALLAGAFVALCWLRRGALLGVGTAVLAALAVVALAGLTFRQTGVWRDTWAMWSYVLEVNPQCWHAHGGLGAELRRRGEYDKALDALEAALQINENSAEIHNNLGSVYSDLDRHADALPRFRSAIKLNPNLAAAYYNLGGSLAHMERLEEADEALAQAIELQPRFARAYHRLGDVLVTRAKHAEAKEDRALARQDYTRARQCYLKAARIDLSDPRPAEKARQVDKKLLTLP